MALRFWTGPSGSGKTTRLFEYIIEESIKNPSVNYFVVVPEQFNLQAQIDLVNLHPRHGILNIDVLSMTRLAHRIFEETGYGSSGSNIIDDMGKNLILRRLSQIHKDELPLLGENLDKLGYITQVKSAISEYMQYGIDTDGALTLAAKAKEAGKGRLSQKLSEIAFLYSAFQNYIKDHYTTREELLIRLCSVIEESEKIRNSVVVFDGFTGFTPVQLRVIRNLLILSKDVHITVTIDKRPGDSDGISMEEHELFFLGKRTISQVGQIADDCHVPQLDPVNITDDIPVRYVNAGGTMLPHLERNLFRKSVSQYKGEINNVITDIDSENRIITKGDEIHIMCGLNPEEEMELNALKIGELIRDRGYRYCDIAVVTGDIETYRSTIERVFSRHNIPYFTDKTQPILLNPMIEYLRAAIGVLADNYSYEAVFRLLKTGLTDMPQEDIDILENYCIAMGIKGRKAWNEKFFRIPRAYSAKKRGEDEQILYLERVNSARCKVTELFAALENDIAEDFTGRKRETIRTYATALYMMLDRESVALKLQKRADELTSAGKDAEAKTYSRIFENVMKVFEQQVDLLGDEKMSIRQFGQLMDAGLDEIRIGTIPGSTDYVQVGDLTRSRLRDVKALFLVGTNDGLVPPAISSGGIISDADKNFLMETDDNLVFAPTARETAYTQRLYIYMMLTKPDRYLGISYSKINSSGESIRPSYLIRTLNAIYPGVKTEYLPGSISGRVMDRKGSFRLLSTLMNSYVQGELADPKDYEALAGYYSDDKEYAGKLSTIVARDIGRLKDSIAAAAGEKDDLPEGISRDELIGPLSRVIARALYGRKLFESVTRLETYANCAYQYFLQHGLGLSEREVYSFEVTDLGTVFHNSLEKYSEILKNKSLAWTDVDDDTANEMIDEAVESTVAAEGFAALYSTRRQAYMVNRIKRIMRRTVSVLKYQAGKGDFVPHSVELNFSRIDDLKALNLKLSDDEILQMNGRIDRVDSLSVDGKTYVKIIDYKSGKKSIDLAAVYEGRQLQLVVYLDAAMEVIHRETGAETVPAGILYYRIDDPMFDARKIKDVSRIEDEIRKELKMTGYVNSDPEIIRSIDKEFSGKSDIIPAAYNKDGSPSKNAKMLSTDEFDELIKDTRSVITNMGRRIVAGDIATAKERDTLTKYPDTCKYCDMKGICAQRIGIAPDELDAEGQAEEGGDE